MIRQFTLAFALALACAIAGLLGAGLAHAQIGNPAGMAPATPLAEREYVQVQIVDHQKTSQLPQSEIAMGQDANLQRYAAATLPIVLQHLQLRQQLHAQATGAAPQSLAAAARSAIAPTRAGRRGD